MHSMLLTCGLDEAYFGVACLHIPQHLPWRLSQALPYGPSTIYPLIGMCTEAARHAGLPVQSKQPDVPDVSDTSADDHPGYR